MLNLIYRSWQSRLYWILNLVQLQTNTRFGFSWVTAWFNLPWFQFNFWNFDLFCFCSFFLFVFAIFCFSSFLVLFLFLLSFCVRQHTYRSVCLSVCLSVGRSVCLSVKNIWQQKNSLSDATKQLVSLESEVSY